MSKNHTYSIRLILFFVLTVGLVPFLYGQTIFFYQDYFPKQKVDSVEWYYGGITTEEAAKISPISTISKNASIYFINEGFPFDNPLPLLQNYFEKRATLTDSLDIQKLMQVFPTDSCADYSRTRCFPIYRDILVFYKNGIAVSVLKLCFSCKAACFVSSNGEKDEKAKCLSNAPYLPTIIKEWVRRGWIDLRKER